MPRRKGPPKYATDDRLQALKNVDIGEKVSGQLVNYLRFADDIDLIAESQEGLQHRTNKVNESSKRLGLKINTKKTKAMAISKNHVDMDITLNNEKLETEVEAFRLASSSARLTDENKEVEEIFRIVSNVDTEYRTYRNFG